MLSGKRCLRRRSWNTMLLGAIVTLAGGLDYLSRAAGQQVPETRVPKSTAGVEQPKPQPIPFSHKLHSRFIPDCMACHELSGNGWEMSYPPEANCMECHAVVDTTSPPISKLAAYYNEHKPVPWVKVYSLPDEVLFSHKRHSGKAKVECTVCHGPVAEREVITKERATWMEFCVDCHKDRKAPANCRTCHNR